MNSKAGRPRIDNPKCERMEIRLTKDQAELLKACSETLEMSKTDILLEGLKLVNAKVEDGGLS